MNRFAFFLLCVLSSLHAEPGRKTILVLGDSLTAGYGLDRREAYPALLQEKINQARQSYEVINAGVSGDTTAGGLNRLNWVSPQPPDIVILALGANDGLRGLSVPQMETNLQKIIERVRAKNSQVKIILAGMQMPPNLGPHFTAEFSQAFRRVATQNHATFLPFLLEGVAGNNALNQPDQIHPNAAGQKIIAETVWKTLEPLLRQP